MKSKRTRQQSSWDIIAKAERALREAVAGVIEEHRRAGTPLIVWRNGKVARIHPRHLVVREPRARYGK